MKRFLALFFSILVLLLLFTFFGGFLLFDLNRNVYAWTLPTSFVVSAAAAAFWKMEDRITALQKRVDELEAAQKKPNENP